MANCSNCLLITKFVFIYFIIIINVLLVWWPVLTLLLDFEFFVLAKRMEKGGEGLEL